MSALPGARIALVLLTSTFLAFTLGACSSDDDAPFDHVADCQARMVRGSPNEELDHFTASTKDAVEHTEVFVSADYAGSDGKLHRDYFHCAYTNDALIADDRRPPAPGELKANQSSAKQ